MSRTALKPIVALFALAIVAAALPAHTEGNTYKVGDKIKNFAFKDAQGKTVSLAQYKGKIVVLNMFATW